MVTVSELKQMPRDQQTPFEAVLLVRKTALKKARNDSEFLTVELADKTGLFHIVCFENSANYAIFNRLSEGAVVRINGHTAYYQNRFSPAVADVAVLDDAEVAQWSDQLVATTPLSIPELWDELQACLGELERPALRETLQYALEETGEGLFQMTTGAISMHHAYRGGLLEHTVRMVRVARAVLPLYPEVDADLTLAGIVLHDVGKCLEYEGMLAPKRSRAGILQGHVVLGYRVVRRAAMRAKLSADLLERLEHIILSHQGEPEWGAAARAATPEAVLVSMIDNLDAKMGMVQEALRSTPGEEVFSEYVPGLFAPLLTQPPER